MEWIYIGLGSNVGDRQQNLITAIRLLNQHKEIDVSDWSSIYETEPVGYLDQPSFLNMVVQAKSSFRPQELLSYFKHIEETMGRKNSIRWGPRNIDLDLLLYGDHTLTEQELTVPHPRMKERAFVMVPLAEIAPDIIIPGSDLTAESLIPTFESELNGVKKWKRIRWDTVFDHFVS